jgi:non-heme chloroperoxidase
MKRRTRSVLRLALLLVCASFLKAQNAQKTDTSPHTVQMIPVERDVTLEVLDWGGTGRPLVLLAGLGDTAHVFDRFAPKLTAKYHVYGITRRGFGASSKPEPLTVNYNAVRLGDDVIAVIEALHLSRPILAGHSLAGEELSFIGFHHPDAVAALIYLDAGYSYALYDQAHGQIMLDTLKLRDMLSQIVPGKIPSDVQKSLSEILMQLKLVEKQLVQYQGELKSTPSPAGPRPDPPPVMYAIFSGQESFPTIHAPALVIFAVPHDFGPVQDHSESRAAFEARDLRITEYQAKAFETQVPVAHVVRIPHASHYVFRSNEEDVLREMNAFISALPSESSVSTQPSQSLEPSLSPHSPPKSQSPESYNSPVSFPNPYKPRIHST